MMLIGAHVRAGHPLKEAAARSADLVQLFLSNPQSWKKPRPREDADELRAADLPIYVHAPYLVNVASPNNRVRIPSRKILIDTCEAAAAIGAAAVIVHGGHVGDEEEVSAGFIRWRKALEEVARFDVQVLIENTAAGGNAVAREISALGSLWEEIGDLEPGLVLDTCHAWSAGEELDGIVERARGATGRIDLVHCNDSRDPFDSRRDRHANLGQGEIPEELLVGVCAAAGAPIVVETPGGADEQGADIAWLRERLDTAN